MLRAKPVTASFSGREKARYRHVAEKSPVSAFQHACIHLLRSRIRGPGMCRSTDVTGEMGTMKHDVHACRSRKAASRCIKAQNELGKSSRCLIMVKVWRLKRPKASCQEEERHCDIEAASEDWQSIERPADQRKCLSCYRRCRQAL